MKLNKLILAIPGIFFMSPVFTFIYTIKESIQAFDSASKLGKDERPSALATSMNEISSIHNYGVFGYCIGIVLMLLFLKKGYKDEARILWIFAIATVGSLCASKAFFLGVTTALVLIWKRKLFRPDLLDAGIAQSENAK